jgi:HAD superfamily hydrolase (TIGR01509 family)
MTDDTTSRGGKPHRDGHTHRARPTPDDIDAVLFDLDGTLCTYERSAGEVLGLAFERAGVEPFFDVTAYYDRFGEFLDDSEDMATLRANCFAAIAGERERDPAVGRAVADAFAAERDQTRVRFLDGAADLLTHLHERGYGLGLVTNGPPDAQRRKLDSLGVADRFDAAVFAGHDTPSKPHPEPFRRALDGVDTRPGRALFVGDSRDSDIAGARAVGMSSAWVAGEGAPARHEATESVTPGCVVEVTGDLLPLLSESTPGR